MKERIKYKTKQNKMGLLTGKNALITGAARGIGKAIALKFASEGANIAFTDLVIDENGKKTEEEIAALGVKAKGSVFLFQCCNQSPCLQSLSL